jgi:hypothetical protein
MRRGGRREEEGGALHTTQLHVHGCMWVRRGGIEEGGEEGYKNVVMCCNMCAGRDRAKREIGTCNIDVAGRLERERDREVY